MSTDTRPAAQASSTLHRCLARLQEDAERGDVPGWVLVTVMTAGIVVAIAGVAAPTLQGMFESAIGAVTLP